jgi:hypothetical protein
MSGKAKKKNNKNRRNRNRISSRYNFRTTEYESSQKPQTYGPGKTVVNVDFDLIVTNARAFKLGDLLTSSPEFYRFSMNYNWYRILNMIVVFTPNNLNLTGEYFKIQMNWENNQDIAYIKTEDNAKLVPNYRTRRYCYKFVPPNSTYLVGEPSTTEISRLSIINPFQYSRTYIPASYYPGRLLFSDTAPVGTNCRLVCKIEFRGSKIPEVSQLKKYVEMLESLKLGDGKKYELSQVALSVQEEDEKETNSIHTQTEKEEI